MYTKEYFKNNVIFAVELDYGFRDWNEVKGSDMAEFLDAHKDSLSDIDYCTKQADDWCRKVLNLAYINWDKNYDWCKRQNLTSVDAVIDYIIDNKLAG